METWPWENEKEIEYWTLRVNHCKKYDTFAKSTNFEWNHGGQTDQAQ